jgi:hypothetical protein
MRIRFPKLRAPMLDAVMLAGLALIVSDAKEPLQLGPLGQAG